ncbi:uncharacterized protein LAESUDRAFT_737427 [Laetiporus sulphureus 93-53]|uniref:Cytochrome c oxidase assembly factor 3 n=1 Tax=Laetiporus sulphureus 93-53 TaxID=1314785 RepID=A0A165DT84_9APHY|nr:uncharacterized protein LAESUDRAFT_737427 [Laetiporus sulphureus 93-53]KZT05580.1 hypothetical protein LAESUDRAFT_737427 [Laetiporus sulphureus 93-53]
MTDQYISPKEARASYRPNNLMSPGLKRAREPFRVRNALTGVVLTGFVASVWWYSISAVKQDVFDDVDEEARALAKARASSLAEQEAERQTKSTAVAAVEPALREPSVASVSTAGRGLLPPLLDKWLPRMLDPSTKTLVWGAPSVDSIGKLWDASRRQ